MTKRRPAKVKGKAVTVGDVLRAEKAAELDTAELENLADVAHFIGRPLQKFNARDWEHAARKLARGMAVIEGVYLREIRRNAGDFRKAQTAKARANRAKAKQANRDALALAAEVFFQRDPVRLDWPLKKICLQIRSEAEISYKDGRNLERLVSPIRDRLRATRDAAK